MTLRHLGATILTLAGASPALAQGPLPLKYTGPATAPAITAGDLMTRVYIFADDSMMGRQVGTPYNLMGTAYIEREVRRLGLKPGGDAGGFFQDIGIVARSLDSASTITVDGQVFRAGVDFVARSQGVPNQLTNASVMYGGTQFDTTSILTREQTQGKLVLLHPFAPPPGFNPQQFVQSNGYQAYVAAMDGVTSAIMRGATLSPSSVRGAFNPRTELPSTVGTAPIVDVTSPMAEALLGVPPATATKGTAGRTVSTAIRFVATPRPGRNVIAIVPGSDPRLRGQYVVVGAHNDHVGFNRRPIDADSAKAFNRYFRPQGADTRNSLALMKDLASWVKVNAMIDSMRTLRPARPDSIYNGADDDGSGSMALLEIAEAYALGSIKPKRSIVLIWHTGEESGMWGSSFFARHTTVPRDSIVAQLNIDMIGRGGPEDVTGQEKDGREVHGDTKYVQLVGSRRLSTELGDLMETVNAGKDYGFRLDYALDANGHPQNIYCRSDHASYAAFGIPVVFFTTGGHADYHQVSDEPQYIRYDHMANLTRMIFDASARVAGLPHRVKVDTAGPFDPTASCRQ